MRKIEDYIETAPKDEITIKDSTGLPPAHF